MKKFSSIPALALVAYLCTGLAHGQAASFTFAQPADSNSSSKGVSFAGTGEADSSTIRRAAKKKDSAAAKSSATIAKVGNNAKQDDKAKTKVHPDVAVKDNKPEEIELPGVMKIAGENAKALDFTRTQVVNITDSGSATVVVSLDYSNHIQTPWINPLLKGRPDQILPLPIDKNDNNIFFSIADGVSSDVQVWLKDPVTNKVTGLVLKPQAGINGQNIILRDTAVSKGSAPKSDSYVAQVQRHAEMVAFGNAPDGYSEILPTLPPIVRNGLVINASRIYSSADTDIYVYDVANPGPAKAVLTEGEFDGPLVTAVTIFPKPVLYAKEHVKVIVEAKKGR